MIEYVFDKLEIIKYLSFAIQKIVISKDKYSFLSALDDVEKAMFCAGKLLSESCNSIVGSKIPKTKEMEEFYGRETRTSVNER